MPPPDTTSVKPALDWGAILASILASRAGSAVIGAILMAILGLLGLPIGATQSALDTYKELMGIEQPSCPPCPAAAEGGAP